MGKENEARAREVYLAKIRSLGHRSIECQPCGLTLMPEHSYLGASGNGIIKKELVSELVKYAQTRMMSDDRSAKFIRKGE